MNDDFNIDDNHGIDDLFRDALESYKESPSDEAWKRLNRKLNRKEVADFVTFKTTHVNSSQASLMPVYRQQWFRLAVAACIILPFLFVSGYYVAVSIGTIDKSNGYYADKNINSKSKALQNLPLAYHNNKGEIVIPDGPFINDREVEYLAENFRPGNNIKKMPTQKDTEDKLVYDYNKPLFANNHNPLTNKDNNDIRNNSNNSNGNQNNNDQQNNFSPNSGNWGNNQPIVDNGNHQITDPAVGINIRNHSGGNPTDSAHIKDANAVDSIIRVNTLNDSLIQLIIDKDPIRNFYGDSNIEPLVVIPGNSGTGIDEHEIIVPNVFTPNADGLNDYLYIVNIENYPDNIFIVQDRKGKVVFNKKEYKGDWNGENAPDGTYFYFLTYKNFKNETITVKGVVYIIR